MLSNKTKRLQFQIASETKRSVVLCVFVLGEELLFSDWSFSVYQQSPFQNRKTKIKEFLPYTPLFFIFVFHLQTKC